MPALASELVKRSAPRMLYGGLFAGYLVLLLMGEHGVSHKGWIPLLEYGPLLVLGLQIVYPNRPVWWLLTSVAILYGLLMAFALSKIGELYKEDLFRLLVWMWVCLVLYFDRPRRRQGGYPAR